MWCWDTMLSTQVSVEAAHFGARVLKRKPHGDKGMPGLKFGFFRGYKWMKLAEIFMGESGPPAHHFQWDSLPRTSGAMSKHAKKPCLG